MPITSPYEWMIYKSGSNYKLFRSNLATETESVIDTQTDLDTLWATMKTTMGSTNPATLFMRNAVYDYDTELTPPGVGFELVGENKLGVVLRPQGNISGFSTNSLEDITVRNLTLLTEHDTAYTQSLLKIKCNAISRPYFNFKDLKINHIVSSAKKQFGSGIGMEMTGASPAASYITCEDITVNGFQNTILLDSSGATGSPWVNEVHFIKVVGIHSFNFVKSNQLAGHDSFKWDFDKCAFQTTNVDGTTGDMFFLDDNATARHFGWNFDKSYFWDPVNTNKKYLKANNNCRINIRDSDPIDNRYMGGAGWDSTNKKWNSGARVKRSSYENSVSGFSVFNASGVASEFSVNPGKMHQNADECRIFVAPIGLDVAGIPWTVNETNRATNQFTVRFGRPPRQGTGNVVIYWEVSEW